jgi:hypothetical protein
MRLQTPLASFLLVKIMTEKKLEMSRSLLKYLRSIKITQYIKVKLKMHGVSSGGGVSQPMVST